MLLFTTRPAWLWGVSGTAALAGFLFMIFTSESREGAELSATHPKRLAAQLFGWGLFFASALGVSHAYQSHQQRLLAAQEKSYSEFLRRQGPAAKVEQQRAVETPRQAKAQQAADRRAAAIEKCYERLNRAGTPPLQVGARCDRETAPK